MESHDQEVIRPTWNPEVRKIRENVSRYFEALITDEGILENVDDIRDLEDIHRPGEGEKSESFFLRNNGEPVFIKITARSVAHEAKVLKAWKAAGAHVPEVSRYGVVPTSPEEMDKVEYIMMNGVVDTFGQPAQNGFNYLWGQRHEDGSVNTTLTQQLGEAAGGELAVIHSAPVDEPFNLIDSNQTFSSWRDYLQGYTQRRGEYLTGLGISEQNQQQFINSLKTIQFPEKGSYIHGDFGKHNILVTSGDPLEIVVIDPGNNPQLGVADPYWDLAWEYIRMSLKEARYNEQHENPVKKYMYGEEKTYFEGYRKGYEAATGKPIDEARVRANQIVQSISKLRKEEEKQTHMYSTERAEEIEIRKQLLRDLFTR